MKLLPALLRESDLFLADTGAGGFLSVFLAGL
jgi:hypothetical protein